MKKLIVVSDWVDDSLTCQEVKIGVEGRLSTNETPNITFVSSYPSTIHTAFLINQIVEIEERLGKPDQTVLFQNTDPRLQSKEGVKESKGAEFIVIKLKCGIMLCGPNAGYNFSMIKDRVEIVYHLTGHDKGSQFRSRDLYSKICAHLMEGSEKDIEKNSAQKDIIPDLKGDYIGHIDNYGNIKTTIKLQELLKKHKYNELMDIEINKIKNKAKFVDNLFGGTPGELVIYPGSSGSKENPYLEITIWRHFTESNRSTGVHVFKKPLPGDPIQVD